LPALTSPTAVFRLHGRNFQGFLKQLQGKAPTVAEKYDYLYKPAELAEIARAAGVLNGRAERVHVAMNNNRGDYPAINGMQIKEMLLEDWHPPDRAALIAELDERRARAKGARTRPRNVA
jgi:uncharacterized protein YecE (DUF72 family)